MKRNLYLLGVASLVFGAASASAAGINLGWNDCPGGASYAFTETFACDTNEGVHTIVGSFVAPAGVLAMSANEVVINVQTGGALLPNWWTFGTFLGTVQCRATASLAANSDFTGGPFTCYDYWQGGAIGALAWSVLPYTTNRCRIKGVFALPADDPRITAVPEGTEVYSFKCVISNAKSTGLGSCAGCSDEACIVFDDIRLNQPSPFPNSILMSNASTAQYVTWQGWSTTDPRFQCPATTPARARTWGSVKALYR